MAVLREASRNPVHGDSVRELQGGMVASGGRATNNVIVNVFFVVDEKALNNPQHMGEMIGTAILKKIQDLYKAQAGKL
jgi:hypothetical protein